MYEPPEKPFVQATPETDPQNSENPEVRRQRIQTLNDSFRSTFIGGKVYLTSGINALEDSEKRGVIKAVQQFREFTKDNDPYREHDFGIIEIAPEKVYWKIDYYGQSLTSGSEDPADPKVTTRVLTIMLASEY